MCYYVVWDVCAKAVLCSDSVGLDLDNFNISQNLNNLLFMSRHAMSRHVMFNELCNN